MITKKWKTTVTLKHISPENQDFLISTVQMYLMKHQDKLDFMVPENQDELDYLKRGVEAGMIGQHEGWYFETAQTLEIRAKYNMVLHAASQGFFFDDETLQLLDITAEEARDLCIQAGLEVPPQFGVEDNDDTDTT